MASVTLDVSLLEIAKSLDVEKAPDKLRCGACHKLNVNAYKTTCCDTYICESCFTGSCDQSCPKCDHKPFTAETCKPNKSMRLTIKSYLKAAEKATTEVHERTKPTADETSQAEIAQHSVNAEIQEEEPPVEVEAEQAVDAVENGDNSALDVQPSVEDPDVEVGDNFEDEVDIQVDLDDDHQEIPLQRLRSVEAAPNEQSLPPTGPKSGMPDMLNGTPDGMGGMDFQNMMNGFGNMDYNQMMQMMAANGMGGINPMMGMPMGMNPMSAGMFGGFGPNGGMNGAQGMNMGMNFNPNQGMFPGWNNQNNNMWQNNNANAFSNGMGGDFGSNYGGFNMAASGNFQQSYPNGDFQSGYYGRGFGRGRGRGRGGYGRGRGNFNQYSQYQQQQAYYNNGPGQQNFQNQNGDRPNGAFYEQKADGDNKIEDSTHEDEEFAPGGQEEVQEALGDDYQKTSIEDKKVTDDTVTQNDGNDLEQNGESRIEAGDDEPAPLDDRAPIKTADIDESAPIADGNKSVPEAYSEDLHTPMPPPSAPLGPSAQYGGRGHGRFSSRGRGSMSQTNGHFAPSVKPFTPPAEPKGVGVVGAPTGPRAMREPPAPAPAPARPASRAANAGFQIMGRASMARSQRSESRDIGSAHSKSPARDHQEDKYDDQSRRGSRQEVHTSSRHDNAEQDDHEYRDKDRRSKKSKRDTYDDYDRDERGGSYDRSDSADRKSSRRSRGEKEKSSSSRHRSSRSKRYGEDGVNGDYEMKDHDDSAQSVRDDYYGESRSKHRSTKSSKYDDRDRDHDRDRDRDRDRDSHRTRDDGRNEKHRDRDHDHDRDRKRSRHDRHREDNKEHNYDYDYEHERDEDEPDSRHRSRRHKRDHRRDGEDTNERSHKSSASTTPAAAAPEKDPHTLEREARNRERMVKEQQRREKAAKGAGGAGRESARRVTYKYEDELERGLVEGERASARWR
ncbi:hypothetical protein PV11_04842 [Exophiala sideris]|uniref:RING-type domain-containing protein n=1 Tax=Exophiala sideris TaxID=1016849 RepID=A0A0D1W1X3_9EURO|nr:hypothetical protein PV11_04842 [Exophiala sideris]